MRHAGTRTPATCVHEVEFFSLLLLVHSTSLLHLNILLFLSREIMLTTICGENEKQETILSTGSEELMGGELS